MLLGQRSGGEAGYDGRMPYGLRLAVVWITACVAVAGLGPVGCDGEEQLPGPRSGTGNAGATTSGAGGQDGEGGDGGGGPAPNLCECSAALGEVGCSDCFNDSAGTGAPCAAQGAACSADAGCDGIRLCVQGCDDDDEGCKQGCILPFDADASHALWREVLACVCGRCVAECAWDEPLECDEGGDAGGGGAGGSGSGGGGGAGGG